MTVFKFVVRFMLTHILIFNLIVSTTFAQVGTEAASGAAKSATYDKGSTLTTALNQKKDHFKVRYIEEVVLGTLGMVVTSSPLPKRSERALSDCMANFAGPVSVGLLKVAGIIYTIGLIRINNQFAKIAEKAKEIQAKEAAAAGAERGNQMADTKRMLELRDVYDAYEMIFEEQKTAVKNKQTLYRIFDAALVVGLALDIALFTTCNKMCKNRMKSLKCRLKEIKASAIGGNDSTSTEQCESSSSGQSYVDSLKSAMETYANAVKTAAISQSSLSEPAHESFVNLMKAYFNGANAFLESYAALSATDSILASGKQLKEWGENVKGWNGLMNAYNGMTGTNMMDQFKFDVDGEVSFEKNKMMFNDTKATTFSTATTTSMASVATAGTTFQTTLYTDLTLSAAGCAEKSSGCTYGYALCYASCFGPVAAAFGNVLAVIEQQPGAVQGIESRYTKDDQDYSQKKKLLSDTIGKNLNSFGEKITKITSKFSLNDIKNLDPSKALHLKSNLDKFKDNAEKQKEKLQKDAKDIKTGQQINMAAVTKVLKVVAPHVASYEGVLDMDVVCCGSAGRTNKKEPTLRIPIPKSSFFTNLFRSDLVPPKAMTIPFKDLKFDGIDVMSKGDAKTTSINLDSLNPEQIKYFMKIGLQNLGLPTAMADDSGISGMMGNMGGLGTMMGFGLSTIGGKLVNGVKSLTGVLTRGPGNRILFYALLLGLNIHMDVRANELIKELDSNLALIRSEKAKAMKYYEAQGVAVDPGKINTNDQSKGSVAYKGPEYDGKAGKVEELCFGGNENGVSKTNCEPSKSKIDFKIPEHKYIAMNYPDMNNGLNTLTATSNKLASDSMALNKMGPADLEAFGKISAAMRAKIAAGLKELRDEHKSRKTKDKMILDQMADQMQSAFNGGPMASMLNQSNTGFSSTGVVAPLSVADSVVEEEPTTPAMGEEVASIAPSAGGEEKKEDGDLLDDLGAAEETPKDDAKAATLDQQLNTVEVKEADINDKKDVSIFQILSNRYLLSYPKVLDQESEPVKEEKKPEGSK